MKGATFLALTPFVVCEPVQTKAYSMATIANLFVYNHSPGWSLETNFDNYLEDNGDYTQYIEQVITSPPTLVPGQVYVSYIQFRDDVISPTTEFNYWNNFLCYVTIGADLKPAPMQTQSEVSCGMLPLGAFNTGTYTSLTEP
jgi:hypothetical protein